MTLLLSRLGSEVKKMRLVKGWVWMDYSMKWWLGKVVIEVVIDIKQKKWRVFILLQCSRQPLKLVIAKQAQILPRLGSSPIWQATPLPRK
jgi:hypothetical protein